MYFFLGKQRSESNLVSGVAFHQKLANTFHSWSLMLRHGPLRLGMVPYASAWSLTLRHGPFNDRVAEKPWILPRTLDFLP